MNFLSFKPTGTTLDPVVDGYTLTADFNIIQGRFVLRYRIVDPFRFATSGEEVDKLLSRLAYRALSREIGTRNIDASLTAERRELATLATASTRALAAELKLGVEITAIDIIELAPPSQVTAAFEDVANARQFAKTIYENRWEIETSCRSSWGDSRLLPGKSPPAAPLQATGGDGSAVRKVFWRIRIHSCAKSAFDRSGQGRRYRRYSRMSL